MSSSMLRLALGSLLYLLMLPPQAQAGSSALAAQESAENGDDQRLAALQDSLQDLRAQLQVMGDTLATRSGQLSAGAARAAEIGQAVEALADSLAAMQLATDKERATFETRLAGNAATHKLLSDSLSVAEVLHRAATASSRRQIIEISVLGDSVAAARVAILGLHSRLDSLVV